jgi:hypothetical protein
MKKEMDMGRSSGLKTGGWLRRTLLTAAIAAGGLMGMHGSALAANGGNAMCMNQWPVVGVWVNVSGGTSGWAGRSGSGYSQHWSYNTQGRPYSLTVGCGGSPQVWASSTSTPYYSTGWSNVDCFPGWSYGFGSIYVRDRCYGV